MTDGEKYRVKAAQFRAKANHELRPALRTSYDAMARLYVRLAEQADRNANTDVVYGPILPGRGNKPEGQNQA